MLIINTEKLGYSEVSGNSHITGDLIY